MYYIGVQAAAAPSTTANLVEHRLVELVVVVVHLCRTVNLEDPLRVIRQAASEAVKV
jgi:hypothetical protein